MDSSQGSAGSLFVHYRGAVTGLFVERAGGFEVYVRAFSGEGGK
jgi:hypothetical protein